MLYLAICCISGKVKILNFSGGKKVINNDYWIYSDCKIFRLKIVRVFFVLLIFKIIIASYNMLILVSLFSLKQFKHENNNYMCISACW